MTRRTSIPAVDLLPDVEARLAAGHTATSLAAAAGLQYRTVTDITHRRHPTVTAATAAAIRAVPATQPDNAPFIDAGPTRQQLRELAAAGYPAQAIARHIGASPNTVTDLRAGRQTRVHRYTARAITRAHAELAHTNPAQHGIATHTAAIARRRAQRNGWDTSNQEGTD